MNIDKSGFYLITYKRDIFLTSQQRQSLLEAINQDEKFIIIDDILIMLNQVREVVPSAEYKKTQSGGHYCSRHPENFVTKGKSCGYC